MAIQQTRFLNSTVINFSASIGWGSTASQLSVNLANDPLYNDSFDPQYPGRPVTFIAGGDNGNFTFTGIIQSYGSRVDTGGFTHEVTVVDPRDVLAGTKLILDGYTGTVDIFNLLNIYGYLESFGYGSSEKNDSGLPWKYVRDAIHSITRATQQGAYGGPIYYMFSRYIMDLSLLPNVPEDYRVGGDSISMLDFITEICEAGGCDFFITMTETTTGIFVIQVNTVSRTAIVNYNAITEFIESFPEFEAKSIGMELSSDPTSRFLLGGPVRELWYQFGDLSIATIWPYWGLDVNGNPIVGTGFGDNHTFVLDSRSVNNPRVGPFYQSDVGEMRAVLGGRSNWETFLILHSDDGSIHQNKAKQLNIIGYIANQTPEQIIQILINDFDTNGEVKSDINKLFTPHYKDNLELYAELDSETGYLYEFLHNVATEYYGRKFMVNIPYTFSAEEPDTNKIRLSQIPVDSAFLDEALWPIGVSNNLLPIDVDLFSTEDGQIICFARFDASENFNFSELAIDSVGFNSRELQWGVKKLANYSTFVKATVDENIVYLNKQTKFAPKAVITLDGVVRERARSDDVPGKQIVIDFLNNGIESQYNGTPEDKVKLKEQAKNKVLSSISQDMLNYGVDGTAVIPNMAAIPLESTVKNYGPWSAVGAPGNVEYENDDSLVPWGYGGFEAMNLAATSRVNSGIGLNLRNESGEITFAEAPFHNLGSPLLFGGPLITDISMDISDGGFHTTYQFKRTVKQPRYGQAKAERVATLSRQAQQMRRNMRLKNTNPRKGDLSKTKNPLPPNKINHPKTAKASSHEMLSGQCYLDENGNKDYAVVLQSDYNMISHAQYEYEQKAIMSLDGIFRPFSTIAHSSLPFYTTPVSGADQPTVTELNPFTSQHDIKLLSKDQTVPKNLYGPSQSGDYRGIGLRSPLILVGDGYDINGNKLDDERVGPLDSRWDENRGVWVASGTGSSVKLAKYLGPTSVPVSGDIGILGSGSMVIENADFRNPLGAALCTNDLILVTKIDGVYNLVNAAYKAVTVITDIVCEENETKIYKRTIYVPSAFSKESIVS